MLEGNISSPESVIKRLEKLRQWQQEQQKILTQKQLLQRQLLNAEQQQLYENYGLNTDKIPEAVTHPIKLREANLNTTLGATLNSPNSKTTPNLSSEKKVQIKNTYLKRGQGLKQRFGVDPEHFRLHNLPKYKYAKTSRPSPKNNQLNLKAGYPLDNKDQIKCNYISQERQNEILDEIQTNIENDIKKNDDALKELKSNCSWENSKALECVQFLNVSNIKIDFPTSKHEESSVLLPKTEEESQEELNIFELLEEKFRKQENSSSIMKSLEEDQRSNFEDYLADIEMNFLKSLRVAPSLFDIKEKITSDTSDSETNDDKPSEKVKGQVRFANEIEIVNEIDTDCDFDLLNADNLSKTSTPNNKSDFEQFKNAIFKHTTISDNGDSTLLDQPDNASNLENVDLIEKTENLKTRLLELETEIEKFQKHNAELTKMKQQYELERSKLTQERLEMEEKMNDKKIKLEVYLHDQRMIIEEERKRYEKLLKELKNPNRKERDEIIKLRDQMDNLLKDSKNKESKHVSAQSRLRAQLRNLEKEIKDLNLEIDHLRKENKKLQSENGRITRDSNNKILKEINKNLAKLAPVATISSTEITNKNMKPVVAKVISHKVSDKSLQKHTEVLHDLSSTESCKSSDSEEDTEDVDNGKTSHTYFPSRRLNKENTCGNNLSKTEPRIQCKNLSTEDKFKREIENADGSKDIWYTNGNLKKISADGMVIRMLYYNKDIKETNISEGTVRYYYADTNTWHTTYLDGLEILEFPNGQTEHRYKDGTIEVHFANGSIRISNPSDENKIEEWRYPDGTNLVQTKNAEKIITFSNGQREIHTKEHKRREYPDGTIKLVYPDGSQETRYSNGRVRLKDKDGKLVLDSEKF